MLRLLFPLGLLLFAVGLLIIILTFGQVAFLELKYDLSHPNPNRPVTALNQPGVLSADVIHPVDPDFGIIVPKINANARVVAGVDPFNEAQYNRALTHGVAQAKGSRLPDEPGNVFIFAHSTSSFWDVGRYNAIFYLLSKMEKGDPVYIFYKGQKYQYLVFDRKIVEATAVDYLVGSSNEPTLTLMTCWPPGTTLKRLLVLAKLVKKS